MRLPGNLPDLTMELPPQSARAVLTDLQRLAPKLWPVKSGPILRRAGDQIAVDVAAATRRLQYMLTVLNDAPDHIKNARGTHFEQVVQEMVNGSPWRPPETLLVLQGRTLKHQTNDITDIDAVACRDNVVVLVQCKSVPYTAELDAGLYTKVRNLRTNVEEWDAHWASKVQFLRQYPCGDNYALQGYQLHGVVCLPFVPFTHLKQARDVLSVGREKLHAVNSFEELKTFFQRA